MSPSPKHFVTVSGNIGAGKTSLTRLLSERLGWVAWYESVEDNPYLADFYADMRAWSFHLQIFFLGHRAEHHLKLAQRPESVIQDRSIYEDRYIFAPALLRLGNLSQRDFDAYRRVYDLVVEHLPPPDLLIYLRASVPTLLERIRRRGRDIERAVSADYLELLNELYESWLEEFDVCPVLTVPADRLDFVKHARHMDIITERILDRLAGKEEVVFPET
jgi:deoxyadenosine/deoxycytidine kinase